ncbi:MAG: beta-glucosidase BglX [Planctomycetes bacterium]|nr:beta-glucosidase BglX [Planctomycetota bacterium]
MKSKNILSLVVIFAALAIISSQSLAKDSQIDKKVNDLIAKMTLEEKVGQMAQYTIHGANDIELENQIKPLVKKGGVGSFLGLAGKNTPELRNELQKIAVEQSRLGIPLILGYDVIHGYRTMFPIPLAQSCSWNLDLAQKAAAIAAKEASAAGQDWTFAPMIDIARDPRWGRIAEGFGEDPYLCSLFAAAKVKGFQGDDLKDPSSLAACLKHFAAYGAVQAGREYHTVDISKRTLWETYLPPFKAGVDAGALTLMTAFNEINGIPASGDPYLLNDILRDQWGFEGFVVSDYNSVFQMISHGYAEDAGDSAVKGVTAGCEMFMESKASIEALPQQVKDGKLSEKVIDEAVRRILKIKYRIGLFENPYVDTTLADKVTLTKENIAVARQLARESFVLLKNDGLLPLKKNKIKTIGIIGPLANNKDDMMGTWAGSGDPNDAVTILDGIKQQIAPGTQVLYAKGCDVDSDSTKGFAKAIKVAVVSDVVIMVIGESAELNGEAHSRSNINLPGVQRRLVELVKATGTPIAVVLITGRPLTISWLEENVPAILVAWHPGIQAGPAVADTLFGDFNPSGKLTVTFPRTLGQVPIFYNHKNTGRPANKKDRYTSKYIDVHWTPLYPFGYGLSYTKFDYSNLKLNKKKIKIGDSLIVTADITNTGDVAGEEIVQLYLQDLFASVTRPVRELKGFTKLKLNPGQTKTVSFVITKERLSFYNDKMKYLVEPGDFKVWVAPDSVSGLEGKFTVTAN